MSTITLPKVLANFSTTLSATISASATTFTLDKSTDGDSITLSGVYELTWDEGTTSEEHTYATMAGAAGTFTRRGLSKVDLWTEVTANKFIHNRGCSVKVTNISLILINRLLLGTDTFNAPDWTGVKSISGLATPTSGELTKAVNVAFANALVTGSSAAFSSVSGLAGENLTVGQVVYLKESDQAWWLADADLTATFQDLFVGLAQATVLAGASVSVMYAGVSAIQSGLVAGTKYFISNTAGALTSSATQTNTVFIGTAISATSLLMSPRFTTGGGGYRFGGQYYAAQATTTVTLDWNSSNVQYIQLASSNQIFTFANPKAGGRYALILKQPASGAAGTVSWPATVSWSGGTNPTLTTTNSKTDVITFLYDGTSVKYFGSVGYNY